MNKCSIIDLCFVIGMSTLWSMDRIPVQSKIILCDIFIIILLRTLYKLTHNNNNISVIN